MKGKLSDGLANDLNVLAFRLKIILLKNYDKFLRHRDILRANNVCRAIFAWHPFVRNAPHNRFDMPKIIFSKKINCNFVCRQIYTFDFTVADNETYEAVSLDHPSD